MLWFVGMGSTLFLWHGIARRLTCFVSKNERFMKLNSSVYAVVCYNDTRICDPLFSFDTELLAVKPACCRMGK